MAYSMTGFGRGEKIYDTRKYSIEIKSVNSRFCDISIRMPRMFNYLDTDVRRIITDRLLRGKIDVFINYEDQGESGQTVTVNTGLAKEYSEAAKAIAAVTGRTDDFGVERIALMQDVLSVTAKEIDEEAASKELLETLNLAIAGMLEKSGFFVPVFECKVDLKTLLSDMDNQSVVNKIAEIEKVSGRYAGWKVGDMTQAVTDGNFE